VLIGVLKEIDDCRLQLEFGLVDNRDIQLTPFLGGEKKGSSRRWDRWRLQLEFGLVDDGDIQLIPFLGGAKGSSRGWDPWRSDADCSPHFLPCTESLSSFI
jgi:hypothetical protein